MLRLKTKHRLMCGDSTSRDDVDLLMAGEKADMVFTSPPYNTGKKGYEKKGKYENYQDNDLNEWVNLIKEYMTAWMTHTEYMFTNLQMLANNKLNFFSSMEPFKSNLVDVMIWAKPTLPAMEPNILNSDFEIIFIHKNEDFPKRHIKMGKEFRGNFSNWFQMNRNNNKIKEHRAGFRVELPMYFIEGFGPKVLADPFLGTGSTLIACEKTGRRCFGMEIDPHYCSVIIKRYQDFSGNKAELTNGW